MKKKILVVGPCLSQSGYGYQTRFALKALKSREDMFDIYVQPITWGKTGWIWEDNEFRVWLDRRITETQVLIHRKQLQPDISLQVTIPNEWKKLAPVNIGYTAGIEVNKVSPQWLLKGNDMDKIIVVSNHSKEVYESTTAQAQDNSGNQMEYKLNTPVETVNYSVEEHSAETIESLNLDFDFNFLTLSQWSPRKNFENSIKWWVEEFIDQEVGLVIKTNLMANCLMDREATKANISALLKEYPDRKCKVYLLHGDLSEGQMHGLYQNSKIKALINIAHGEGFGLPMFEAAVHGTPVLTIGWSGQLDYLHHDGKNYFQEVNYTMQPVQQNAIWPGVIEEGTMWAFADQGSYKMKLRKIYKDYDSVKDTAKELQTIVRAKFSEGDIYKQFVDSVIGFDSSIIETSDDTTVMEFE